MSIVESKNKWCIYCIDKETNKDKGQCKTCRPCGDYAPGHFERKKEIKK